MPAPETELLQVTPIKGAGRGVVAKCDIARGVEVLTCQRPAAHVIFREYRKEVCAQCFHYDRGRTLSVRRHDIGKVFCSQVCESTWCADSGEHGLQAWRTLTDFVNSNTKHISITTEEMLQGPRPTEIEVVDAWRRVDDRTYDAQSSTSVKHPFQKTEHKSQLINPDILGLLLSAVLIYHSDRDLWQDVKDLAVDPTPYTSQHELQAHCRSFCQLSTLLPAELTPSCTSEVCLTVVQAGSHNAFGIRSGGEDAEEYLGFAVYPQASYFNHSCAPNLNKQRLGRIWHFFCSAGVERSQQLCISYLGGDEKDLNLEERRKRLQMVWHFVCQCNRCLVEAGVTGQDSSAMGDTD